MFQPSALSWDIRWLPAAYLTGLLGCSRISCKTAGDDTAPVSAPPPSRTHLSPQWLGVNPKWNYKPERHSMCPCSAELWTTRSCYNCKLQHGMFLACVYYSITVTRYQHGRITGGWTVCYQRTHTAGIPKFYSQSPNIKKINFFFMTVRSYMYHSSWNNSYSILYIYIKAVMVPLSCY